MKPIYIAFGANLSNPKLTFQAAIKALQIRGVDIVKMSGLWQSPAWPPGSDQPDYINACAEISFNGEALQNNARALLNILHDVEAELGRKRTVKNAARPLDLDLLDFRGPMARVTVEDCVEKVPNRFDLVLLASHRSRNISAGAELTVDRDNDKTPVVSLRELADETLDLGDLRESLVSNLQRVITDDDMPDVEEDAPVLALEHGEAQPQAEMDENELLRALQSDRDNDNSSRF